MKTKTRAQILICKPDIHLSIQGQDTTPEYSWDRTISLLVIVPDAKLLSRFIVNYGKWQRK